ncbi:hypothetical protein Tco_0521007 [Tanacetum coccineum]
MQSSSTRPSATTRHKGKEIAKPVTPQSESVSEEDSDPEQARRDKDMQKNLALLAKKPKRVKDYAYHKEKMMMCKQAEQGVPLQAEQADWLEDTDEEIDEQELIEAHHSYMQRFRRSTPEEWPRSSERPDSMNRMLAMFILNSSNICTNDNQVDQNAAECVDERVALANLIANLTLDTEENKTVVKAIKFKAKHVNARTKKPNVVPISASKPKRKVNKSVATPHKKTVASDTTIQKSKSYYKSIIEYKSEWNEDS